MVYVNMALMSDMVQQALELELNDKQAPDSLKSVGLVRGFKKIQQRAAFVCKQTVNPETDGGYGE